MFRVILLTQWKMSRLAVVFCALAGFTIPLLSVQSLGDPTVSRWDIGTVLASVQAWGLLYPLLAGLAGLLFALTAWLLDHTSRHVYALSLPVPRWHYTLLRFGGGAVLLAIVATGVLLGALVGVATSSLPPGLYAYPFSLTLRFVLAAFVAYTAFFAISAGTTRTAGYILAALGGVVLAQVLLSAAGSDVNYLFGLLARLYFWPGPLEVFTGRWMLVDV